ncbi:MAG TPA: hypothetical protein VKB28_15055 [Solirubrobacteraceae bacterium]|nr:hypothetical protein [Solirubrobacteraceae bacterium]
MRARLIALTVAALLLPAAPAVAGDPIMPLSQVRSGMQCTGYSVVRGTTISEFGVEILDVVDGDASGQGPRLLVRVSGPAVDGTGVGPGFSGSPIYCPDDRGTQRNAGAISESLGEYGGEVVLATPIEAILGTEADAPADRAEPARAGRKRRHRALLARAKPLATPLTVSGLSTAMGRALERAGARKGRQVIAAPAGPLGSFPPQPMVPGASVGVSYSMGDIQVGAIGTVAYVDGDRVWAFGHPFEGAGARRLLLQDAYVYRVIDNPIAIPGAATTYKYASLGHTLGTISNDERDAVSGRTGALPPTVPVRVFASDLDTGRSIVTGVRAADESRIGLPEGASPVTFVGPLAVTEAAASLLRSAPGRLSADVCVQVSLGGLPGPVRFCNRYVSAFPADEDFIGTANTVAARASQDVFDALARIDDYQGTPPRIGEVAVRMDIRRGERRAFLRSVKLPRRVRAGQRVRARVTLRRVRGGVIRRSYRMRIPRELHRGKRTLRFTGTDVDVADDGLLGAIIIDGIDDGAGDPGPRNLRALAKGIRRLQRYDGVRVNAGSGRHRAFRDRDLRISGRASARVRVVR